MTDNSIFIAMSGGVDSAVAAYLASRGRTAAGVTMRLLSPGIGSAEAADSDVSGAAAVCRMLGIPHFVAELGDDFRRWVVDPFIAAYEAGLTPNPCVFCNKSIKFGALLDFAAQKGYGQIATGHYARLERDNGRTLLRRAADAGKDQTYMLWSLSQEVLSRAMFPLGELSKADAREIAASLQFPMAERKDSQDICFIPDGDYAAFISRITGKTPESGDFIDLEGRVLGRHKGQLCYTLGQRKGLGIALGKPAFVVSKSAVHNTVTLGENSDLFSTELTAGDINLIPFDRIERPMRLLAKARYRQEAAPAWVEQTDDRTLHVVFDQPQRAISPGQSLVLYDGDYVVGGGIIQ
ncbi:MAG: tRNA 2-thiouridine(34) synthase MnmA [Clostridia bacterium]|nr:tRNA 2-thiouridine(34) synthase MnmA [Clostridia bacterium]